MTPQLNNGLTTPFCWVRFSSFSWCSNLCVFHPPLNHHVGLWFHIYSAEAVPCCSGIDLQPPSGQIMSSPLLSLLLTLTKLRILFSLLFKHQLQFCSSQETWLNVFFKLNVCEILTVNYTYYRVVLPLFLSLIFSARLKLLANALILIFFYDIT